MSLLEILHTKPYETAYIITTLIRLYSPPLLDDTFIELINSTQIQIDIIEFMIEYCNNYLLNLDIRQKSIQEIFTFLNKLHKTQIEIPITQRMDASNLAIIMEPNLFPKYYMMNRYKQIKEKREELLINLIYNF